MSWASNYIEDLDNGKTVQFRPRGNSMTGRIESGQLVTVVPVLSSEERQALKVDDIVLCTVHGSAYLHIIRSISQGRYRIGNNKGHINGWIAADNIYGKCIKIED